MKAQWPYGSCTRARGKVSRFQCYWRGHCVVLMRKSRYASASRYSRMWMATLRTERETRRNANGVACDGLRSRRFILQKVGLLDLNAEFFVISNFYRFMTPFLSLPYSFHVLSLFSPTTLPNSISSNCVCCSSSLSCIIVFSVNSLVLFYFFRFYNSGSS